MTREQIMRKNILQNNNTVLKREFENLLRDDLGKEIIHQCSHVPVEEDISPEDFKRKYVLTSTPVILRGIVDKWDASKRWSLDFFKRVYYDVEVTTDLYNVQRTRKETLGEVIAKIKQNNPNNISYLQEWWLQAQCPELLNDITLPEHFADDENYRMLGYCNHTMWMGQGGAFTPIHQDSAYVNVWSAQLQGEKRWMLFDRESYLEEDLQGNPMYDSFISNNHHGIYHCILLEGDILFMPYKWWHRAETISDSISLNTFYVTEDIAQLYFRDLMAIPLATSLNRTLLEQYDPMRLNICLRRAETISKLLGLNTNNIRGLDTTGAAVSGIYESSKAA